MADLDIRMPPKNEKIDRIIFGDDNRDGLGKHATSKLLTRINVISFHEMGLISTSSLKMLITSLLV